MWPWYQQAFCDSFAELGYEVSGFSWNSIFWDRNDDDDIVSKSIFYKFQYKFLIGPTINKLNKALIDKVINEKPEVVFFYNCQHIKPQIFKRIKTYSKIIQYYNDDPFSRKQTKFIWRFSKKSIKYSDLNIVFREKNIKDFNQNGSKRTNVLLPYYCKNHHYPIQRENVPENFLCDVVFAGHYEDDGRLEFFESLLIEGINFKLYGGGWNKILLKNKQSPLFSFYPVAPAIGKDYVYAICGSKIALCFYSKINSDTYTSRNFEIPAMKKFLLTESSKDLQSLFKETELDYFQNFKDLKEKISFYLENNQLREEMELNLYNKVISSKHEVLDRVREIDCLITTL